MKNKLKLFQHKQITSGAEDYELFFSVQTNREIERVLMNVRVSMGMQVLLRDIICNKVAMNANVTIKNMQFISVIRKICRNTSNSFLQFSNVNHFTGKACSLSQRQLNKLQYSSPETKKMTILAPQWFPKHAFLNCCSLLLHTK